MLPISYLNQSENRFLPYPTLWYLSWVSTLLLHDSTSSCHPDQMTYSAPLGLLCCRYLFHDCCSTDIFVSHSISASDVKKFTAHIYLFIICVCMYVRMCVCGDFFLWRYKTMSGPLLYSFRSLQDSLPKAVLLECIYPYSSHVISTTCIYLLLSLPINFFH